MSDKNGHPIHEASVESRLLHAALDKLDPLQLIHYKDLSDVAHIDVRTSKGRGYLTTAIRMAQRGGKVFRAERGVGIVRCDEAAIAGVIEADRNSGHRKFRRSIKKGECADLAKMPEVIKTRFLGLMSQMSMLAHASKEGITKKLILQVEKTQKQLPLKEMLEAMK